MYDRAEECDCFNDNVLARPTAFMTKSYATAFLLVVWWRHRTVRSGYLPVQDVGTYHQMDNSPA